MTARRYVAAALVALVFCAGARWLIAPASALDIQRIEDGGIEAWLVEDHSIPLVTVRAAFRGGARLDPPGKGGVAGMVGALVDEGAGALSAAAFQQALEDRAIDLSVGVDRDSIGVSMRTLSEHRDEAASLLATALALPRFDADAVERVRGQRQSEVRRAAERPNDVAWRTFYALSFPDHPYGRPIDGDVASLSAITRDDLIAFHRSAFVRDRLLIAIVGDLTRDDARALVRAVFAPLPASGEVGDVGDAVARTDVGTVIVPVPSRQSSMVFGHPGVARDHPDFYAYFVVGHVLGGGGLTSRLFARVREREGLAYSISAGPQILDHAALFVGDAGTANERRNETVALVREEWRRLAEHGVGEEEVADAKAYLVGSLPLSLTSSSRIAATLVSFQQQGLGIDYLSRRPALIEAVTRADADRVASALFDGERMTMVVAGQPDTNDGGHPSDPPRP